MNTSQRHSTIIFTRIRLSLNGELVHFFPFTYWHLAVNRPTFQKMLETHKLSLADYVHLYSPALDWLLQCIAHKAPVVSLFTYVSVNPYHGLRTSVQEVFQATLAKYRKSGNSLVLNHIISSFPPDYIAANARPIAALIKVSCEPTLS